MKQGYYLMAILSFAILCFSNTVFAQITETDKKEQEEVLQKDPQNFAAHFIVGAYYYNMAIEPHEETTKMGLVEYLEDGRPYEEKKEKYLKMALPYFENAYAVNNKDIQVKNLLKTIYQEIGEVPRVKASTEEINAAFEAKLSKIEFQKIEK